jgi:lipopolysaccharide transport system ATP-binding protein
MSRREIQRKFDEIVAFAEIEDFLDTPVKRYSSGMYVRLAFAVAAHLEPEILIVDEVLAVGDAAFQQKCLGKMQTIAGHGRTVLFVSHNMAAVESLCRTAIELADGQLRAHGSATTVTSQYRAKLSIKCGPDDANTYRACRYIRRISLIDDDGNPISAIRLGSKFRLRIDLDCDTNSTISTIGIGIDDLFGQRMLTLFPPKHFLIRVTTPRKCTVYCYVEHFPLRPGLYTIKCALSHLGDELESITGVCPFEVIDANFCDQGRGFHAGVCIAKSTWDFA